MLKNTSLGYDTGVIYKQTILNTFSSDVHRTQSSSSSRAAPSSKSKSGPKDVPSSQDMFADSEDGSDSEPIVSQVRVQNLRVQLFLFLLKTIFVIWEMVANIFKDYDLAVLSV